MSETTETENISINSVRLTSKLFEEICELVDEQYHLFQEEKEKIKDSPYLRLHYTISSKRRTLDTSDSANFLKRLSPENYADVDISLSYDDKRVNINLRSLWGEPRITLTGKDPTWVHGLSKRFEDIFKKYATKNNFFHSKKAYVFYFPLHGIFILGMSLVAIHFIPQNAYPELKFLNNQLISWIIFLIGFPSGAYLWSGLFEWLFPKVEIENSMQVKIRKWILALISGIIIALISGGILIYIQSLKI